MPPPLKSGNLTGDKQGKKGFACVCVYVCTITKQRGFFFQFSSSLCLSLDPNQVHACSCSLRTGSHTSPTEVFDQEKSLTEAKMKRAVSYLCNAQHMSGPSLEMSFLWRE